MQWDTDNFVGMGMGEVRLELACTQVLLCLMTDNHKPVRPEQWCLASQLDKHVLSWCTRPKLALGSKSPSASLSMPVSAPAECAQISADQQSHPQSWHGEGEAAA